MGTIELHVEEFEGLTLEGSGASEQVEVLGAGESRGEAVFDDGREVVEQGAEAVDGQAVLGAFGVRPRSWDRRCRPRTPPPPPDDRAVAQQTKLDLKLVTLAVAGMAVPRQRAAAAYRAGKHGHPQARPRSCRMPSSFLLQRSWIRHTPSTPSSHGCGGCPCFPFRTQRRLAISTLANAPMAVDPMATMKSGMSLSRAARTIDPIKARPARLASDHATTR